MSFPNLKVSGNCQTECRQVIRQERGSNPSGLTHSVLLTYIFQYSLNELTDIHWFGKMGIHSGCPAFSRSSVKALAVMAMMGIVPAFHSPAF